MIVEPLANPPQQLWQEQTLRWLSFVNAAPPAASFDQDNEEIDPDPPPAAPAVRRWPRVFPEL